MFFFVSQGSPGVNGKRGKQGPSGEQVSSRNFSFNSQAISKVLSTFE